MINSIISFVSWKAFALIVTASLVVGGLSAGVDHGASVYKSETIVSIRAINAKIKQENEALKGKPCDTLNPHKRGIDIGVALVDTNQPFIHGIVYGKLLYKDSLSRHKFVKRLVKNGIVVTMEGDYVTVSGISKNSFTESGKATSHPINFK